MSDQRPVAEVPRAVLALLALSVAAQIAWQAVHTDHGRSAIDLPPAPSAQALRLASFGEAEAAARLTMLYLQSFDLAGGNVAPYRNLDYGRLVDWLAAILALDPRSQYPLFAAARVYADTPDPARMRIALDLVYRQFLADPDRRWPWLAHAALLAKHRLKDLALARRYAQALDRHARAPDMPLWARQMEIFILEDMNELEAAKIMLGGLLERGEIDDPGELRFLKQRLEALEARLGRKNVN